MLCQYTCHWQQHDGLLNYCIQLYVPAARGAHTEILCRYYDDPMAGHFEAKRTREFVVRKYNWPGMARTVKAHSWACSTCQCMHPVQHRPHGMMEPLPQRHSQSMDILVDFIVGLPVCHWKRHTKPYNVIFAIVNQYTKQAPYFPCNNTLDAVGLAEILTRKLVL